MEIIETKTASRIFNQYEDFNPGDVVRLKSGGPDMTVDSNAGSRLVCVWFDGSTYHRQNFDQATVGKIEGKQT